jgi:hypothetical protein
MSVKKEKKQDDFLEGGVMKYMAPRRSKTPPKSKRVVFPVNIHLHPGEALGTIECESETGKNCGILSSSKPLDLEKEYRLVYRAKKSTYEWNIRVTEILKESGNDNKYRVEIVSRVRK